MCGFKTTLIHVVFGNQDYVCTLYINYSRTL